MTKFLSLGVVAAFLATPAFAGHHEDCADMEGDAKTQCETAKAAADKAMADAKKALEELGDCSDKEGDDKTACETKRAELSKAAGEEPAKEEEAKGGKAARGNTNRMEEEAADE
jgi:hypothetical protein